MLNIGIIGCGKITQVRHAPEYQENPNCRLAGFARVELAPGESRTVTFS